MNFILRSLPFAVILALLFGGSSQATGIPIDNVLRFTVLRDGSEIGSHVIGFTQAGEELDVTVTTDIAVRIPLINIAVYHFVHRGHEIWRSGQLRELSSATDDDGTEHTLDVRAHDGSMEVKSDVVTRTASKSAIPASLWNMNLIRMPSVMNTLTGEEMAILVEDKGVEAIEVNGTERATKHYAISGALARDVWYDNRGVLVKVRFDGKDGSVIQYVLK